jgi:hypothetical protein
MLITLERFVFASITDALEPCAALPSLTQFATVFHLPASLNAFKFESPSTHRRLLRWKGHLARMPLIRAPRKILASWVDNPRPLGCLQMNWGRTLKKALQSYDLPREFVKLSEMAADRNQLRAICGSKMSSATKETPTSPRHDIWAKLRYGTVP